MKILYFHQHFSTRHGATGTRSYEMARQLLKHGHTVTIVCGSYLAGDTGLDSPYLSGQRRGLVDGIDVVELELPYSNSDGFIKRGFLFIKFALRSVWIALTEPCDLIIATSTPLTAAIPGIVARWLRGKKFIFEVRDLWPELPREMGVIKNRIILATLAALEWASYRSADRMIGLSPGIVEGIARLGISRDDIAMIPNGCDLNLFNNETSWRPEGVKAEDLMVVYAGTHGIANGLDAVIDVAVELKKRAHSDIKFVLIGQGKKKSALQERASREELDNVIFHDPIQKTRLVGLLKSADIGMQILANVPAFYYGTSPNKFFDYIASGLPVLNNYPGWIADLISEYDCGFVVPPDNPIVFADTLEHIAENKNMLSDKRENALKLARMEFNRSFLAEKFVSWAEGCAR